MRTRRFFAQRPPKQLWRSAGMPCTDNRDDFYLAKCCQCPDWTEIHDKRPVTACRHACKHAYDEPGHESYVVNVTRLTVPHRYRFDPLPKGSVSDEPPF